MKNSLNSKEMKSITDHPLFQMINGHPTALIMVSALRKEMTLPQIYDLFQSKDFFCLTRLDSNEEFSSQDTAIMLSMEASLLFLKNLNKNAYNSLLTFALLPAGLTNEDSAKLMGIQWEEHLSILSAKGFIILRASMEREGKRSSSKFRIEQSYQTFVTSRASAKEITETEHKVIDFITEKTKSMYINHHEKDFVLFEGNMWEILKWIKKKLIQRKKTKVAETNQKEEDSGEESWVDSDEEHLKVKNTETLTVNGKGGMKKLKTYQKRQHRALKQLQNFEEDSASSMNTDSDMLSEDEDNSYMKHTIPINGAPKINIGGFEDNEMQKKESKKNEEKEIKRLTTSLFKNKMIEVTKELFVQSPSSLFLQSEKSENLSDFMKFRKPLDLNDILLEDKDDTEMSETFNEKLSRIYSIIYKNKVTTSKKGRRSSIRKFL